MSCPPLGLGLQYNWPGFSWQSWVPFVPSTLPSAPGTPWHSGRYLGHLLMLARTFQVHPFATLRVSNCPSHFNWKLVGTEFSEPSCQLPHRLAFDSKAIFMPIPQKGAQTNNNRKGKNNKNGTGLGVVSSRS